MAACSAQLFDRPDVRDKFLDHYDTLRGRVREEIVRRHLLEVLLHRAARRLRVVDIGCGDGRDAIWLAEQGHEVLALDLAERMVEVAQEAVASADMAERVEVLLGD